MTDSQMTTAVRQDVARSLSEARQRLTVAAREVFSRGTSFSQDERTQIVRAAVPVEKVSPLQWLAVQRQDVKTYWSGRETDFAMAGVGVADTVTSVRHRNLQGALSYVESALADAADKVRYYGAVAFDGGRDHFDNDGWRRFEVFRFVLPRFELVSESGETWLVCNLRLPSDLARQDRILSEIDTLTDQLLDEALVLPSFKRRIDTPDADGWRSMVQAALRLIESSELQKIVLAKQVTLELSSDLDPINLLRNLQSATGPVYCYCFQIEPDVAFLGASPERLYARRGRDIVSEAVGGTRPRGATANEDAALANELLHSPKDLHEHRLVVEGVRQSVHQFCHAVECHPSVAVMQIESLQHLSTRLRGSLARGVTDADIVETLYPTPAVAGFPRDRALMHIRELEPFDRGWYAGPAGWIGRDAAEFAVAIRCGLLDGEKLHVYAGAGIVHGSTAESEYREVEDKIAGFTRIFEQR
ncbi:MAG: isochorismate synthase [Candidatus Zixiibacteriota bacterium]